MHHDPTLSSIAANLTVFYLIEQDGYSQLFLMICTLLWLKKLFNVKIKGIGIISLFCCLATRSLDVERNVSTAYCKSASGDGVDWLWQFFLCKLILSLSLCTNGFLGQ